MAVKIVKNDDELVTLVAAVIDESGSMSNVTVETINGYNEFVQSVQTEQADKTAYVSTFLFDSGVNWIQNSALDRPSVRVIQDAVPLKDAVPLTTETYRPNGGTPLYDAIGYAITAIDKAVEEKGINKVTLVIQTDGQENSSKEYSHASVTKLIEDRNAQGWQILFLGADLGNAVAIGRGLGIHSQNSMAYSKSATQQTFNAVYANTVSYRTSAQASNLNTMTDEEKAKLFKSK